MWFVMIKLAETLQKRNGFYQQIYFLNQLYVHLKREAEIRMTAAPSFKFFSKNK